MAVDLVALEEELRSHNPIPAGYIQVKQINEERILLVIKSTWQNFIDIGLFARLNEKGEIMQYVTWGINQQVAGNTLVRGTINGHYHHTLEDAVKEFNSRG